MDRKHGCGVVTTDGSLVLRTRALAWSRAALGNISGGSLVTTAYAVVAIDPVWQINQLVCGAHPRLCLCFQFISFQLRRLWHGPSSKKPAIKAFFFINSAATA